MLMQSYAAQTPNYRAGENQSLILSILTHSLCFKHDWY